MSYTDVECPYCGEGLEIDHDDGQGYAEDEQHEQECSKCEKTFVFTTSIMFSYSPYKADCLNGEEHKLKPSRTYPKCFTKMYCADCDYKREPTDEERAEFGIETYAEYEAQCEIERKQKGLN